MNPFMTACQCELHSMIANKSGVQLKLSGGSKLLAKSLNIKGYQLSLEKDQQAVPDMLSVSLVRKRRSPASKRRVNNEVTP